MSYTKKYNSTNKQSNKNTFFTLLNRSVSASARIEAGESIIRSYSGYINKRTHQGENIRTSLRRDTNC